MAQFREDLNGRRILKSHRQRVSKRDASVLIRSCDAEQIAMLPLLIGQVTSEEGGG